MPAATTAYASGVPTRRPASVSATLPRNPDIGGMPARFMAGTKNSTPSSGASRASPPSLIRLVLPARRSTSPSTRNSVVWMVMWWAT